MAAASLVAKLKLTTGNHACMVNALAGYLQAFTPLPKGVNLVDHLNGKFDWLQVFVKNKAELEGLVPQITRALKPGGLLWITFPKGSSEVQTDLTRDAGWDSLRDSELKWINLVSVDETWSAFSLRPYRPIEARQSFR
jgi:hypothetical protein